jgi:hypothetical protein
VEPSATANLARTRPGSDDRYRVAALTRDQVQARSFFGGARRVVRWTCGSGLGVRARGQALMAVKMSVQSPAAWAAQVAAAGVLTPWLRPLEMSGTL